MKTNFKNRLLLGAAVTALSFGVAGAAHAAALEIDDGTSGGVLTANNELNDGDNIIGAGNGTDELDIDTNTATARTLGDAGNTAAINVTDTNDAEALGIIDGDAADGTLTLVGDGNGDAITVGNGAELDLFVGGNHSGTNSGNNVIVDINGNIATTGSGKVDLQIDEATAGGGNLLKVSGNINVGTGGTIVFNDADGIMTLDGTTATQTITGTIDALTGADRGVLNVENSFGTGVTFESKIGNTLQLGTLNVGTATAAGDAVFNETVDVNDFNVNAAEGTSTADFNSSLEVDGNDNNIDGGDATGENATVNVAGDVIATSAGTSRIRLDDNSGSAMLILDGTAAQTVDVLIDAGATAGEGTLKISNTDADVNIENEIGATSKLKAIVLDANTTVDIGDAAGNVDVVNATDTTLGAGSTLRLNDSGGDLIVTSNINGAGTLNAADSAVVRGDIGKTTALTSITVADGETLTVDAVNGDVVVNATTIVTNDAAGQNAGFLFDAQGNKITVSNMITSVDGQGLVQVAGAGIVNFTNLGTATDASVGKLDTTDNEDTTINVSGNLYVADIDLDDEVTLNLTGSGVVVEGTVDGAAASDGNVTVASGASVTFSGAIGTTSNAIDLFKNEGTVNLSKNVAVRADDDATVAFDNDGTLNIDVTNTGGNFSIVNDTNGDIDLDGTVNVFGSTNNATIDAAAGGADAELFIDGTFNTYLSAASATTTLGADAGGVNIGADTTQSTTVVAGNQIALTDATTIGNGTTNTTLDIRRTATFNPATSDVITSADDVTLGGNLVVGVASNSLEFDSGETILVIDDDGGAGGTDFDAAITAGTIQFRDTGLLTLRNNGTTADDLKVIVGYKDAVTTFTDGAVGSNAANTLLNTVSGSTTGELETIRSALQAAGTSAAAEEIAESIVSTVDGGNVVGATTVASQSGNIVQTRMASLSNGTTGMTAGNISQGLKVWGQGFGSTGTQDRRDGVDGFDVDTYGLAVGIDTETLADNWIWGLAFSYADTEVDSDNANTTNTEIDSYQVTLYANYDWDDATYISGQLGYAWGDNETRRQNVGGTQGLTASGDFDSDTFNARVEAGRSYEVGSNTTLTPHVLANYMHYDADSYTETGAGTANLVVDQDSLDMFELGIGVDASWMYQQSNGAYMRPELSLGVRHDVIGDEVEATNRFTGAGASFKTEGFDPAQTTFNVGAGVTYFSTTNWELSAEYDFEVKSDYDAHSGLVRAAYKF